MDCGEIFRRLGTLYRGRPMAVFGDDVLSGHQLYERGCRLANALLQAGVAPQDRVATLGPNARRSLEEVGGLALGGFTRVPLHHGASADAIHHMLADSQARFLIADAGAYGELKPRLGRLPDLARVIVADDSGASEYDSWLASAPSTDPGVRIRPDDMIQLGYTGGTTGRPKGAIQTHGGWLRVTMENLLAVAPLGDADGYLAAGPLSGAAGSYLFSMWTHGVTTYVAEDFSPQALARQARVNRPTVALMLPPVIEDLLAAGEEVDDGDFASLRVLLTMGAALRVPAIEAITRRFGPILTLAYGQSEALPAAMLRPSDLRRAAQGRQGILASVGLPTPTSRIVILDTAGRPVPSGVLGEITVDTPGNMRGYWRAPEATADKLLPDGMVRTGDVGYLDADGYLYVEGRSDDMIRARHGLIVPQPIERLLERHPAVIEAAVVGVPGVHAETFDTPRAVVQLRADSAITAAELLDWAFREGGVPGELTVVTQTEELPKSHVGKLLRRVVRDLAISAIALVREAPGVQA
jgi:acyl-coenzyme A synthetase/AMP-(fatty) acid ligase